MDTELKKLSNELKNDFDLAISIQLPDKIRNDEDLENIAFLYGESQNRIDDLEANLKDLISPMKESISKISAMFKSPAEAYRQLRERIKPLCEEYLTDHDSAHGMYLVGSYGFEITSECDIPREFLTVDTKKLKDYINRTKGLRRVTGINITKQNTLYHRRKKNENS